MNQAIRQAVNFYLDHCSPGYKPEHMLINLNKDGTQAEAFCPFPSQEKQYIGPTNRVPSYQLSVPFSLEFGFKIYVWQSALF